MVELNTLTIILIINSIIIIGLILNQNETLKDSGSNQKSSQTNPFEKLTWICLFFQCIILLIEQKVTNF